MIKIQQFAVIATNFLIVWYLSACTYDPQTIVKTPRASQANLPTKVKEINAVKYKFITPLSDSAADKKRELAPLPIIGINLSDFKKNLIGLNKFEVTELLDKPSFKRKEHPASIWQYQSSICFIDIFFYNNNSDVIVDHVETRSKTLNNVSEKQCFSSLLNSEYSVK